MSHSNPYTLAERLYDSIRYLSRGYRTRLAKRNPEAAVRLKFQHTCKRRLNLEDPTLLPDLLQWLKLNTDTSQWTQLADKYAVREYVTACGLQYLLNELYASYRRPEDIDWESLPDSFVLKLNNGCHSVVPVASKSQLDKARTVARFRRWMKQPFGYASAELHYVPIQPRIIVEKYLEEPPHKSLTDYKLYCIGGKVQAILVCQDRQISHATKALYSPQWSLMEEYNRTPIADLPPVDKPQSLTAMIEAAEKLASPFPFVRVDFYEIQGRPIFGEMTFTPAGGYKIYGTQKFYEDMGAKLRNHLPPM